MKKHLSRMLSLALAVVCLVAVALTASAADVATTKFVLPNTASQMTKLPKLDTMPEVLTKTWNGFTHISVGEDVDSLTARWLGYYDENETVDLEDRKAVIELDGHNYQLGARNRKGGPNQAFEIKKDDWTAIYTRAGKLVRATKSEKETNYFSVGQAGSTGSVRWDKRISSGTEVWYVAQVTERYTEGDIAALTAQFNQSGKLVRYYVTYRVGEDETYQIEYTKDDKPIYGNYSGKDADGNRISAYTASKTVWADSDTHELATSVSLNWKLLKLTDRMFKLPPRLK